MNEAPQAPVDAPEIDPELTVWKCEFRGQAYFAENLGDIVENDLAQSSPGEAYTITHVRMRRSEFEALPDFEGF